MTAHVSLDLPVPASALAIGAHPDDIEFGCGATLAKWAASGCIVHHLVCTDGSKGTWDPAGDIGALVALRQEEQREAARRLGASGEVHFLGDVDGELAAGLANRDRVARIIRELRPAVLLGHDPWRRWRLHPDHRAAGWLCVDGVVAARDPHFHPEHGIAHHRPDHLLLFECEEPDHVETIDEQQLDTKTAALLAHRSQYVSTMEIGTDENGVDDPADVASFEARVRAEAVEHGAIGGVALGEAFRLAPGL